jgi:transglutaminase-like putative cysteine protease
MEETGMIWQALFKRLFHFQEMILMLSLIALACLPISLSELVRDAGLSLLLPVTLIGTLLTWALANWKVRKLSSEIILLFLGPLALYIRIGQMGGALFELVRQSLLFIPAVLNTLIYKVPLDFSFLLSSMDGLAQKIFGFGGRLLAWVAGISHGIKIEDPVVRTFLWSVALWLVAVWAGWQIYRNKRFMSGMIPSTILLILVLNLTGKDKTILWFHLALLLFLYGFTNYHALQSRWNASHIDYAESTSFDTLMSVGVITLGLVFTSIFVSTFSLKEFLDNFREKQTSSSGSQSAPPRLKPEKDPFRVMGFKGGMPRSYLLSSGPELSTQLAMTISTGDLSPMPQSAHPIVPRYYWRALTYSIYTGAGWENLPVTVEDIPAGRNLVKKPPPNYRIVHEDVTFSGDKSERLFWAGTLVNASTPFTAAWTHKVNDNSTPDMLAALATIQSYKAESLVLDVSAQDLRNSPSLYPDWVQSQFLALPDSVPERVLALARDLTASEPTAYDRALAIQNYLREFPYTLDIPAPPPGRDVADYFLFDLKQGYCDYYATSMVVLARAAGLPARLVAGYANGAYDIERAQYIVTENYAHSWVEIYFANIGWVEFEPTAGQPAILHQEKSAPATPAPEVLPVKFSLEERFASFLQSVFKNAWFPVILIFFCGLLWFGVDSLRLSRITPARTIQLIYGRLRRLARPVTGYASRNQTAHAYASTLIQQLSAMETSSRLQGWLNPSHDEIVQLTELFSRSLFAPLPPNRAEARDAIKTWSRLRWRLLLANMLRIKNKLGHT